jgi:diguanylate cyclase (GGDEF)-like protein
LTIIIIDTDDFKKVNDTYGHLVGDQVLINLVKFCQENIRSMDIFARYGGEEFVILMPETDCTAAQQMAERLCERVAQTPMTSDGREVSISLSMGIACWDGIQNLSFDALLARADQALYQSKQLGRNRVSVWQEP